MSTRKTNRLPMNIVNDTTGISYTLHGDYYLPDLINLESGRPIGRWGMMRMEYLQKNHPGQFSFLILSGKLYPLLHAVDEQAELRYQTLMKGFIRSMGITEELKQQDQLRWVQLMNTASHDAEENVIHEIIFE